ncbi:MAG: hypothetical protein QXH80_03130, partial [Candidatus Nanoarchaeia archaeon]
VMSAAVISMIILAGCASVQKATKFNGQKIDEDKSQEVAHINVDNWGLYFLWIPLAAGSTDSVGTTEWLGKDTVKVEPVVDVLTRESKNIGATKTLDIVSSTNSMMIPFPFPFLFYLKEVQVSGNAVK